MTEADILSVRNELTDMVISIVSVSFGMVSAYIVGLWLFLKRAPLVLRALSFIVFSFGLAFMGAIAFLAIYFALFVLTFLYRWPDET